MKMLSCLLCLSMAVLPLRGETIGEAQARQRAASINVAAASDLSFALQEMIAAFEHETGTQIHLTLGSSGNFYAQIVNGAPFDLFLSADMDYPKQLEVKGYAVPGSVFTYGLGALAVWVPKQSALRLDKLGMQALLDNSVQKIATANPEHAPYGRAAVAAMEYAKVYDRVKTKLVLGENVSQAAQFVQSGAAEIGVIALSIAVSAPMRESGRYWIVPADMYPLLEQGAVLLKRAGPAAKEFHQWLHDSEAQRIFSKYGFAQ
jgi:molybdate transport system substrate-binding protein